MTNVKREDVYSVVSSQAAGTRKNLGAYGVSRSDKESDELIADMFDV